MKARPDYASIPVIVTTQNDGESDEVAALSHGATDFVAKPYKPQVILHRVASIINLRETAAMINQFQYDRLTGPVQQGVFLPAGARSCWRRIPDKDYDIICSDIENFKLINDVFGIPAGDRLLCGIADMYTRMVGERGLCGRFHADQFVCLLEHSWEYYRRDVPGGRDRRSTPCPAPRMSSMKWGIYRGRRTGPFPWSRCATGRFWRPAASRASTENILPPMTISCADKLLREQAITDGMEAALTEGQFEIYLQPKYRIQGRPAGRARRHWSGGTIRSGAFSLRRSLSPCLRKTALSPSWTSLSGTETCAALQVLGRQGTSGISLSPSTYPGRTSTMRTLTDILMNTVNKYGLSPSRLHLEITESAYTENPQSDHRDGGQPAQAGICHRDGRLWQRVLVAEHAQSDAVRYPEAGYEIHPERDG